MLLRFANIPIKAHAGIIASSDNEYNVAKFIKALRMQFATIHQSERGGNHPRHRVESKRFSRPFKGLAYAVDGIEDVSHETGSYCHEENNEDGIEYDSGESADAFEADIQEQDQKRRSKEMSVCA